MSCTDFESDIDFLKGEVTNLGSELETYFGVDGIVWNRFDEIERRVRELTDWSDKLEQAVRAMADEPGNPFFGAERALSALRG